MILLLRIKLELPQSRIADGFCISRQLQTADWEVSATQQSQWTVKTSRTERQGKHRKKTDLLNYANKWRDREATENKEYCHCPLLLSSPQVTLEHSSIRETSCLCNSCYSTVTSNCRYVVFSSVTDCPLFARAPAIWDSPVIEFQTLANQQIPKSQQLWKVIWNKKRAMKPYLSDNSGDDSRRV